jgi:hypothetical protein
VNATDGEEVYYFLLLVLLVYFSKAWLGMSILWFSALVLSNPVANPPP